MVLNSSVVVGKKNKNKAEAVKTTNTIYFRRGGKEVGRKTKIHISFSFNIIAHWSLNFVLNSINSYIYLCHHSNFIFEIILCFCPEWELHVIYNTYCPTKTLLILHVWSRIPTQKVACPFPPHTVSLPDDAWTADPPALCILLKVPASAVSY